MTVKSAKAKGRRLQQLVRDLILDSFPTLELDTDVRSAIMGETGEDIKLSSKARKVFPYSVECKSLKKIAVYNYYDQAASNTPEGCTPLVVLKQDRRKPLALVDLEKFMELIDASRNSA
jgi:hypothetical protein